MRPTGTGDVEELLASTPTGSWAKVTSWSEFVALSTAVESPANTWTFSEQIWSAGDIVVPAGVKVVLTETAGIYAQPFDTAKWTFDVDGSAFSGPIRLFGIIIEQQSAGSSSASVEVSGVSTRLAVVSRCTISGGRTGVVVDGYQAACDVDFTAISAVDRGFVIRNTVGNIVFQSNGLINLNTNAIGVEIESSVTINGVCAFNAHNMTVGATQYVFAISDSVVVATDALVQISGGVASGSKGRYFRQDVGDMHRDDVRLVVAGTATEPAWKAVFVAARRDTADPILVAVSAANTDSLIPFSDAALNLSIAATTESRFALVKNAGITDWYIHYLGPLNGVTVDLSLGGLGRRFSGAGPSSTFIKWQISRAPAHATWDDVPASEVDWRSPIAYEAFNGASVAPAVNTDDRFRPVLVNETDAEDIELGALRMLAEATL